jgi:hypothetical protein
LRAFEQATASIQAYSKKDGLQGVLLLVPRWDLDALAFCKRAQKSSSGERWQEDESYVKEDYREVMRR